jgi:hypothetical protein
MLRPYKGIAASQTAVSDKGRKRKMAEGKDDKSQK